MLDEAAAIISRSGYNGRKWLKRYTETFKGCRLKDARVLDVGAGCGWASFFAATCGAEHVTAIEPESDGSHNDMLDQFKSVRRLLGLEDKVTIFSGTLEDFPLTEIYDLVVINNAINHFNESACSRLHTDSAAKDAYRPLFDKLAKATAPGGTILITDCSRRNFFGDLGLRSPFAPTIEWDKHQTPKAWADLLKEHGFRGPNIGWMPVIPLGTIGRLLGSNSLGAYFINSQFRMTMLRAAGD